MIPDFKERKNFLHKIIEIMEKKDSQLTILYYLRELYKRMVDENNVGTANENSLYMPVNLLKHFMKIIFI